jgi:hypothetical protein
MSATVSRTRGPSLFVDFMNTMIVFLMCSCFFIHLPLWCVTGVSFLGHQALFFRSISNHPTKPAEHRSRIVSSIHAAVGCVSVLFFLYVKADLSFLNDPDVMILGNYDGAEQYFVRSVICFSTGYFISDLVVMLECPDVFDKFAILHHLLIMPFFILGIYYNVVSMYHFLFLLEELSTPLNNWRWALLPVKDSSGVPREVSESAPKIRANVEIAFAAVFVLVRSVPGLYFCFLYVGMHQVLRSAGKFPSDFYEALTFLQFTACLGTRFLNMYWIKSIFAGIFKRAAKGGKNV